MTITIRDLVTILTSEYEVPPRVTQRHTSYQEYEANNFANLARVPEVTQYDAVGRIFANSLQSQGFIMSLQTARDLKILPSFPNPRDSRCLADVTDRTYTKLGRVFLYYSLVSPPTKLDVITRRQHFTKTLSENFPLQSKLAAYFEKLKENEGHILSFFAQSAPPVSYNFRHLGCTAAGDSFNSKVNQYSPPVTLSALFKTVDRVFSAVLKAASIGAFAYLVAHEVGVLPAWAPSLEGFTDRTVAASGLLSSITYFTGNPFLRRAAVATSAALSVSSVTSTIGYCVADVRIESHVQNKLVEVAHYVRYMEEVYNLLLECPDDTSSLEHFEKLKTFFEHKELTYLISLLKAHTFDSKAQLFFCRGPLLLVWEKLLDEKVKQLFEGAFLAIAEIDTALSVVKLLSESSQFSFPKYVTDTDEPFIHVKELSNPTISFDPDANRGSILLGQEHTKHVFLTASNGLGKSTQLRAITYAAAALQGLGIAPAKYATISVFNALFTSNGLKDSSERSLHQAHCQFTKDLITFLDKNPEKKTIVVLDEFFNATNDLDGASLLGGFLEILRKRRNVIVLAASHHLTLINKISGYAQYTIQEGSRKIVLRR